MIPRFWYYVIGAVVLLVIGTWAYLHVRPPDFREDVARSIAIDSAKKVQDSASVRVDTVIKTLVQTRTKYVRVADSVHSLGDTTASGSVTLADTAKMWYLRWELRGVENDNLRLALKADTVALDSALRDRNRWHMVADSAVASQDRLRRDLAAKGSCHLLPLVPCPSRKVALIAGALGTYLVMSGNGAKLLKGIHVQTGGQAP